MHVKGHFFPIASSNYQVCVATISDTHIEVINDEHVFNKIGITISLE